MNSITKFISKSFPSIISDIRAEVKKESKPVKGRYIPALKRNRIYKFNMGLDEWKQAIALAEDVHYPDRWLLYELYRNIKRDGHVFSQTELRTLKTIGEPFVIMRNGKEDEKATRIMRRTWHKKYMRYCIESRFYGHSLVEFQEPKETSDFTSEVSDVLLFPREHVKPETGEILINPSDKKGIPYRDNPAVGRWLMEFGDPMDLGIYLIVAKDQILKNYSRTDWAKHSEKFGSPILVIKTGATKDSELDKLEDMAANFGNNLYAILGDQDEPELMESNKTSAHEMYLAQSKYSDEQISKTINMQSATSDEKAFVGSAEVQERQLDDVIRYDMESYKEHFNESLKDFLIRQYNYTFLAGGEFEWVSFMREKEQIEIQDEMKRKELKAPVQPNKPAKANFKAAASLASVVAELYGHQCGTEIEARDVEPVIEYTDVLAQRLIKKVYDKVVHAGDIDEKMYTRIAESIWKEVKAGYGKRIDAENLPDTEVRYIQQLQTNVNTFSAFKNYQNIKELVSALVDENGAARTWSEFKKAAKEIHERFNVNWLKAEFNHARASARMAAKWVKFENRKDVLPSLKYRTVGDGRVRPDHRLLEGVTYPVDDPFWNTYYPPNGWNCRCTVTSTPTEEIVPADKGFPDMPDMFKQNAAKLGQIFPEGHPYYQASTFDAQQVRKKIDEMK